MTCPHCNAANTKVALFCLGCGSALRAHGEVACENHSGTPATGVCIICGKPVCGDCSIAVRDKMYCDDFAHSQLITQYTKLAAAATEFDAEVVVKNLSANGVPARQYSAKKFSQFGCLTDNCSVSIFVKTEMIDEARRLVEEMDLEDFLIHETVQS